MHRLEKAFWSWMKSLWVVLINREPRIFWPHPKVSDYRNSLHTFRVKLFFNESTPNVVLSAVIRPSLSKYFYRIGTKISGKNVQISLQEYLNKVEKNSFEDFAYVMKHFHDRDDTYMYLEITQFPQFQSTHDPH